MTPRTIIATLDNGVHSPRGINGPHAGLRPARGAIKYVSAFVATHNNEVYTILAEGQQCQQSVFGSTTRKRTRPGS